jgi:beta-lactamase regulating signal transducer with metallopeptidase domain
VLVHEQEHARRRDPLRRLLTRAATDVLIYLPLFGWWRERRLEHAELCADREAIHRVGARAVARALMAFDGVQPNVPAAAGFDETAQARIDQLLGEEAARQHIPIGLALLSAAGVVAALSLFMCVGAGTLDAAELRPLGRPRRVW